MKNIVFMIFFISLALRAPLALAGKQFGKDYLDFVKEHGREKSLAFANAFYSNYWATSNTQNLLVGLSVMKNNVSRINNFKAQIDILSKVPEINMKYIYNLQNIERNISMAMNEVNGLEVEKKCNSKEYFNADLSNIPNVALVEFGFKSPVFFAINSFNGALDLGTIIGNMFSYYFEKKKFDTQVGFFREGQELARTMAFSQNELFSMSKDLCEESFNSLAKSFIELKNKKIILIKVLSQNLKKVDELFRTKVSKMYAVEDEMDELDELKTALESAESKVTFDLFKAETTLNNDKISNFDKEKLKIKITYIKDKLTESTCLIRRDRKEILIKMATRLMAKLEGK
jgi:hypothetical protein